jgi:hypothetical protein
MAEQQTPHPSRDALAEALRERLPLELHSVAAPLAALLAGSTAPEAAEARLRSTEFAALRERLAGQTLSACSASNSTFHSNKLPLYHCTYKRAKLMWHFCAPWKAISVRC